LLAGGEAELESYRYLQSPEAMPESALRLLLRGVSTRNYEGCLEKVAEESFGTKRSSVSRHWVKATAKQIRVFAERRFDKDKFVAIFMDGVAYGGEMMLVALGVTEKGHKIVLGIRQAATENAVVCKELLMDLKSRGLDTEGTILWILDGSLALAAAVKAIWGNRCLIQRCQQHKIRNVVGYLADKYQEDIRERMTAAYASKDWHDAEERLLTLVSWLKRINADAAASLREGLQDTLTVQKLGLPAILAKSLVTTNPIESVFSAAATLTDRVKRWRQGSMRMRWAVAGALRSEKNFNRLKGYREIPMLQEALERKIGSGALDETAQAA
jgi:transposase-like protein